MIKKLTAVILFAILVAVTINYYTPANLSAGDIKHLDNNQDNKQTGDKMDNLNIATFGGGCFWGVEAAFQKTKGVRKTSVGFMGGKVENPSYQDVCYTETGHAEVCQVEFDPNEVSYLELLKVFFDSHNPTQMNYQGPDIGTQYRTVIFFHNEEQKMLAEDVIKRLDSAKVFKVPIVTTVEPAAQFYMAEDYHQQYFEKKGVTGHCGYGTGADLSFILDK